VPPYSYKVEGIGEDFFPSTINLVDHRPHRAAHATRSASMTRALARLEGIYTGGSGGAAVKAASNTPRARPPKNIVVLLPDSANRYLGKIFDDDWMREHGFLDPDEGLGSIRDLLGGQEPRVYTVKKPRQDPRGRRPDEGATASARCRCSTPGAARGPGHRVGPAAGAARTALHEQARRALRHRDDRQYEVADPDAPVGLFNHIFTQGKVIVVWERGEVRGLITKIDVIDYLAHKRRTP
jgi:cystathionine beta-synthase